MAGSSSAVERTRPACTAVMATTTAGVSSHTLWKLRMMKRASGGSKDESYEHVLMCLICRSLFDDYDHQPKFLPCHHTFCKDCLREYCRQIGDEIECPSCRKIANIPAAGVAALQTNFYVKYIQSLVSGGAGQASHSLECRKHASEKLQFYCKDCEVSICKECCSDSSYPCLNHEKIPITKITEESHQKLDSSFSRANATIEERKVRLEKALKNLAEEKDSALLKIDSTFEQHAHTLTRRATLLKNKVIDIYNEHVEKLENDLMEISTALTCIVSLKDYHEDRISHGDYREFIKGIEEIEEVDKNIESRIHPVETHIVFEGSHGSDKYRASAKDLGRVKFNRMVNMPRAEPEGNDNADDTVKAPSSLPSSPTESGKLDSPVTPETPTQPTGFSPTDERPPFSVAESPTTSQAPSVVAPPPPPSGFCDNSASTACQSTTTTSTETKASAGTAPPRTSSSTTQSKPACDVKLKKNSNPPSSNVVTSRPKNFKEQTSASKTTVEGMTTTTTSTQSSSTLKQSTATAQANAAPKQQTGRTAPSRAGNRPLTAKAPAQVEKDTTNKPETTGRASQERSGQPTGARNKTADSNAGAVEGIAVYPGGGRARPRYLLTSGPKPEQAMQTVDTKTQENSVAGAKCGPQQPKDKVEALAAGKQRQVPRPSRLPATSGPCRIPKPRSVGSRTSLDDGRRAGGVIGLPRKSPTVPRLSPGGQLALGVQARNNGNNPHLASRNLVPTRNANGNITMQPIQEGVVNSNDSEKARAEKEYYHLLYTSYDEEELLKELKSGKANLEDSDSWMTISSGDESNSTNCSDEALVEAEQTSF